MKLTFDCSLTSNDTIPEGQAEDQLDAAEETSTDMERQMYAHVKATDGISLQPCEEREGQKKTLSTLTPAQVFLLLAGKQRFISSCQKNLCCAVTTSQAVYKPTVFLLSLSLATSKQSKK